jgi:hypothetical protein
MTSQFVLDNYLKTISTYERTNLHFFYMTNTL